METQNKSIKMKIKNSLVSLLGSALLASTLVGCNLEGDYHSRPYPQDGRAALANIGDLDMDGYPDVIAYKAKSYGAKERIIFKKGYGPTQSFDQDLAIVEFKESAEFYKEAMPLLMSGYHRIAE